MNAIRLKTEHLINPIGIDIDKPLLTWNCEGGARQTAYQIIATADDGTTLWDSDKVESTSMRARWGGLPVKPRTAVTWQVQLWDENNAPGEITQALFETGLPKNTPWEAKWITGDYKVNKHNRYPVDCFCKRFKVADVKKARLYITACGLYEAHINGRRVGGFCLAPGITDYRKRVQYQTYDVTALLNEGENTIKVQLADGWYRGSCGAWGLLNQYGSETKFIAQLEITDNSGAKITVLSDDSWQWSDDGPIRFADNKDGEKVDARKQPSYSGHAKITSHNVIPSASDNVPVTEHEHLTCKLIKTPKGRTVLDFGQNIAGYISITIPNAKAGDRVYLRFGEMLDANGEFTQKNIQCSNKKKTTPLQEIKYICKDGLNEYKTTFAVFGFQYVEVEADFPIVPDDFTAIAVYSDIERTGYFESSNELLNKFVDCTVWSTKNNSLDIPTDCPTRERHGWSGDAQIFSETANFLFDYETFSEKYLQDMYDWQTANGCLPQIAPEGGTDPYMRTMNGSVGWADAGVLIPYVLWKQYGDSDVLKRFLPGMRRYVKFMEGRLGKWHLLAKSTGLRGEDKRYLSNSGQCYGEWAEPDDVHHMTWKDCAVPHPEEATAYTAFVHERMAEIEEAVGSPENALYDREVAGACRQSYRALLAQPGFSIDTDRQAKLVRPLYMNLLDENQTEFAKNRLIQALDNYGWRVGTGFLSTPLILNVLADIDIEYSYKLLENEKQPGWLVMPKTGATTIWEDWEGPGSGDSGIASLDHYSKGAVVAWLFGTMCGIKVDTDKENHFIIAPKPGGKFTFAKAQYKSIYGNVACRWEREKAESEKWKVKIEVTVPVNCTATVVVPDGRVIEQGAGTARY